MLVGLQAQRLALVVPVLPVGFCAGMVVVAVSAWHQGGHNGAVAGAAAFAAVALWMALDDLRALRIEAGELRSWSPFRRRTLRAEACAIGVRLQSGSRSAHYTVFVTDGESSVDVAEFASERGARRRKARLEAALYGGVPRTADARARREVESVEQSWQASVSEAKKTIDAYYASPTWRRSKYLVAGLVIAYSLGMLLYQYFTGRL